MNKQNQSTAILAQLRAGSRISDQTTRRGKRVLETLSQVRFQRQQLNLTRATNKINFAIN